MLIIMAFDKGIFEEDLPNISLPYLKIMPLLLKYICETPVLPLTQVYGQVYGWVSTRLLSHSVFHQEKQGLTSQHFLAQTWLHYFAEGLSLSSWGPARPLEMLAWDRSYSI